MQKLFFYYFFILNFATFILYAFDKYKAKTDRTRRISEKKLHLFCLVGGFVGAGLSMVVFRHKISKKSFMLRYYGIVFIWIGAIYFYFSTINPLNFLD